VALSLSPSDAMKMLNDVESARADANRQLHEIESLQQDLLARGWHGNSASDYGKRAAQQQNDFKQVSLILNDIADKGSAHLKSFVSSDNG
jgi:uncharacterized protein YukE